MICNITSSSYYQKYCNKRNCGFHPCSQVVSAHRQRLGKVVLLKGDKRR